ncbi:MAG: FliM/FliN family flagellar motor switch protein [Pseudomonadota bacterium]
MTNQTLRRPSNTGMAPGPHSNAAPGEESLPGPRGGVLTQAEIEALLRPNLPDDIGRASPPERIEPKVAPSFEDAEQTRRNDIRRSEAGQMAARLALALGRNTGVKAAIALDEVAATRTETLSGLLDGKAAAIACFGFDELHINTLVCFPAKLADLLIARACGADHSTGRDTQNWTLSAIDCALLEQLIGPIASALGPGLSLQSIETDIGYVTSVLPAGDVLISEFGVETSKLRSELAVITSDPAMEDALSTTAAMRGDGPSVTAVLTARVARLSVPLSRLTSLRPGATLLLGVPADQPVEMLSGGRDGQVAFEGQIGRKGNKVAIKVTSNANSLKTLP